ncbi:MAG: hypothetical protein F6K24_11440 [Okeania sp. SIO2D1]|nr:hypothetical protein [Okeania sp. SIO2D1]
MAIALNFLIIGEGKSKNKEAVRPRVGGRRKGMRTPVRKKEKYYVV